jgi:cellulose synthase/poly-beta-1,6-N-acetylglucosamine synthase-like glycosyltransferase
LGNEAERPTVTIVIPCRVIDDFTIECIKECEKLRYPNFEIIVLPDGSSEVHAGSRTRIIETGRIKPLAKRFKSLEFTNAEIVAFIDSDAYPKEDWLEKAVRWFARVDIGAVAGPSLTPVTDGTFARVSGMVMSSLAGTGTERIRYIQGASTRLVTEAPTCNLIFRRSVLESVKTKVPDIWPGEEIGLCGAVVGGGQWHILYDPEVVVYHHRRDGLVPHIKQILAYSVQKGKFLKVNTGYVRPIFFLPSVLVFALLCCALLPFLIPSSSLVMLTLAVAYASIVTISAAHTSFREQNFRYFPLVALAIFATHLTYGFGFAMGLTSRKPLES